MINEQVIGIYDYIGSGKLNSSKYYFRYLVSSLGEIDTDSVREVYDELYLKNPTSVESSIGPFDDVRAMNRFAYQLCEKISAKKMSLISVKNYNQFMENAVTAEDFFNNLFKQGEIIENQEFSKPGIFKNIFNN